MRGDRLVSSRGALAAIGTLALSATAAALVALVTVVAAPRLVGGQSYSVLSNSMAPTVETGDLVIVTPRRVGEIEVGEIVAFADPDRSGRTLQHRVQRVRRQGSAIEVVTMGDANTGYERWRAPAEATVGRVAVVISKAGYVFGPISRPIIRQLVAATAWLALLGYCLVLIWRRPDVELRGGAVR